LIYVFFPVNMRKLFTSWR